MSAGRDDYDARDLELALPEERRRLVGLCTALSGRPEAAEDLAQDLAQETLIEAWRHRHALREPARRRQWLSGIARNVCRRWKAGEFRRVERGGNVVAGHEVVEAIPDDVDLSLELERHELAELLDRALGLLPPVTRAVLVQRYMEDWSHAAIALQLGISEGAVRVRLHRGQRALRRILQTDLRQQAISYGLIVPENEERWRETRIWCPGCGKRRVAGLFSRGTGEFALTCPVCNSGPEPGLARTKLSAFPEVFGSVTRIKPAYFRLMAFADRTTQEGLRTGLVPCARCGRMGVLRRGMPASHGVDQVNAPGVHIVCVHCCWLSWAYLDGLVLQGAAMRQFWREHPRMYALPPERVEVEGRPAIVYRARSRRGSGGIDVISALDTYEELAVYQSAGE